MQCVRGVWRGATGRASHPLGCIGAGRGEEGAGSGEEFRDLMERKSEVENKTVRKRKIEGKSEME